MSRPYAANYAIGFMFVLGVCTVFQSMCALAYPELNPMWKESAEAAAAVSIISSAILALASLLLVGISAAHKMTMVYMSVIAAISFTYMSRDSFDFIEAITIGIALSTILLLATKPCREYYEGWGFDFRFYERWFPGQI